MQSNLKKDLRVKILTLLRNQEEEQRLAKSLEIHRRLFKLKEFQRAKTILFYASFDGEVETSEMIRQAHNMGKRVGLPKILKKDKKIVPIVLDHIDDLENGAYGIFQPGASNSTALHWEDMDMVIVPGVAFDRDNNRLGRGHGYYDRFLRKLPPRVTTVGLAFDFQIVDDLPVEPAHDMRVSRVLTG